MGFAFFETNYYRRACSITHTPFISRIWRNKSLQQLLNYFVFVFLFWLWSFNLEPWNLRCNCKCQSHLLPPSYVSIVDLKETLRKQIYNQVVQRHNCSLLDSYFAHSWNLSSWLIFNQGKSLVEERRVPWCCDYSIYTQIPLDYYIVVKVNSKSAQGHAQSN